MKKISFILVCLFMVVGMSMAQNQGRGNRAPRETAKEMTDRMTKEFKLNDDQKAKLLEVNDQYLKDAQKRFEQMRGQGSNNGERPQMTPEQRDKMRKEMTAAREAYDAKIKEIFTEDQFKAYQKKEAEARSQRQNRN